MNKPDLIERYEPSDRINHWLVLRPVATRPPSRISPIVVSR